MNNNNNRYAGESAWANEFDARFDLQEAYRGKIMAFVSILGEDQIERGARPPQRNLEKLKEPSL